MSITFWISFSCYFLVGTVFMIFGIVFMTRSEFMPYHSKVIGKDWNDLEPNLQLLLLGLMRIAGSGFLLIGISNFILLFIPFRAHETWALFTIPIIGGIFLSTLLYVTTKVKRNTPASPPVGLSALGLIMVVAGFVFSMV